MCSEGNPNFTPPTTNKAPKTAHRSGACGVLSNHQAGHRLQIHRHFLLRLPLVVGRDGGHVGAGHADEEVEDEADDAAVDAPEGTEAGEGQGAGTNGSGQHAPEDGAGGKALPVQTEEEGGGDLDQQLKFQHKDVVQGGRGIPGDPQ